jgi:hypothetical protein
VHRSHTLDFTAFIADSPPGPVVHSSHCAMHAHACSVCVYLSQARSIAPPPAAAVVRPLVTSFVVTYSQRDYSFTSLGSQSPRGPPAPRV